MKPTTNERLDKHDQQIAAIRALLREGMLLLAETRKDLRALAVAQRRTQQKLQKLTDNVQ